MKISRRDFAKSLFGGFVAGQQIIDGRIVLEGEYTLGVPETGWRPEVIDRNLIEAIGTYVDPITDKIQQFGLNSLTRDEKTSMVNAYVYVIGQLRDAGLDQLFRDTLFNWGTPSDFANPGMFAYSGIGGGVYDSLVDMMYRPINEVHARWIADSFERTQDFYDSIGGILAEYDGGFISDRQAIISVTPEEGSEPIAPSYALGPGQCWVPEICMEPRIMPAWPTNNYYPYPDPTLQPKPKLGMSAADKCWYASWGLWYLGSVLAVLTGPGGALYLATGARAGAVIGKTSFWVGNVMRAIC